MAIVASTLVGIVQDFKRLRGLFELINSLFIIRIAVRMLFESQFFVGLLQFFRRRIPRHSENFIIITLRRHHDEPKKVFAERAQGPDSSNV